jgi:hypothetical protein
MGIKIDRGTSGGGSGTGNIIQAGLSSAAGRDMQRKQISSNALTRLAGMFHQTIARGGGGGGSSGGGSGGGSSAATRQGFAAELQRQAAGRQKAEDQELRKQKAIEEASEMEYSFSRQQKQEMSKIDNSIAMVRGRMGPGGDISPEQGSEMISRLNNQKLGYEPAARAHEGFKFEPGREVGKLWKNEAGDTMTSEADGTPKLVTRYDQSPEYQAKQEAAKAEQAQADRKVKLHDLAVTTAEDRRNQTFDYVSGTTVPGPPRGKDEEGKEKERGQVPISPDGVRAYMKKYDDDIVAEKEAKKQQVIEQAQQAAQAEAERNRPKWHDNPEYADLGILDIEKSMGRLGHPMFIVRKLDERRAERPLRDDEQAMYNQAMRMLQDARGGPLKPAAKKQAPKASKAQDKKKGFSKTPVWDALKSFGSN